MVKRKSYPGRFSWSTAAGLAAALMRPAKRATGGKYKRKPKSQVSAKVKMARSGSVLTQSKNKRRSRSQKTTLATLKKEITEMKKCDPKSIRTYKVLNPSQLLAVVNEAAYQNLTCFTNAARAGAVNDLKINIGTASAGTMNADIDRDTATCFKNVFTELEAANNHSIPVILDVYVVRAKTHTNVSPSGAIDTSDDDIGLAGTTKTNNEQAISNVLIFPSDLPHFNQQWAIIGHEKRRMAAGDIMKVRYNTKNFIHRGEAGDQAGTTYLKGDVVFLVRIQGVVAHGNVNTTEVGYADGGVDIVRKFVWDIEYEGTGGLNTYRTINNLQAMVTFPVVFGPDVAEIKDDS